MDLSFMRPVGKNILIRRDVEETESPGGIALVKTDHYRDVLFGEVISVGGGVNMSLVVGSKVLFVNSEFNVDGYYVVDQSKILMKRM